MAGTKIGGNEIGRNELKARIDFETNVRGMEAQFMSAIDDGEAVTSEEVEEFFEDLRDQYNEVYRLPSFAEARIIKAKTNVKDKINSATGA